jgi:hypothetical protein
VLFVSRQNFEKCVRDKWDEVIDVVARFVLEDETYVVYRARHPVRPEDIKKRRRSLISEH